jgi:hypothetical protein
MEATSFDLLTKTLVAEGRFELIAWLSGKIPLGVDMVPTALVRTDVVVSDHILRAELPGDPPAVREFHIELQTGGDPRMNSRMLEYRAWANRQFREIERRPVTVSSRVIYLDRNLAFWRGFSNLHHARSPHEPGEGTSLPASTRGETCLLVHLSFSGERRSYGQPGLGRQFRNCAGWRSGRHPMPCAGSLPPMNR